jgi:hypothetical protein
MEKAMLGHIIIREWQNSKGTGDEETWNLIYEKWRKATEKARNIKSKEQ